MRVAIHLLAVAALFAVAQPATAQYGGLVRCESRDDRDNYCPANTRDGVRLVRQLSRSACWEGESWGYDRRGIWVTNGCRAEFEVGGERGDNGWQGRPGYGNGYDRPGYGGSGRPGFDDRGDGQHVFCESRDFRYNYCPVRVPRDVDLVRQQSRSECRFNRSWGWDRGGIWVDRGCAAEFVVF